MLQRFFKSITAGVLVAALGVSLATPVQAQGDLQNTILESDLYQNTGTQTYGSQSGEVDLVNVAVDIINFLLGLVGIIFLILVIYAGFLWMTAGGNEDQVSKAKKLIINSVIGIVIIVAAYAFTNFVLRAILGALN